MNIDQSATIEAFLNSLAAKEPTPGGGAVAAMTGAMSAGLAEMVVNYSLGKPALAAYQTELQTVLAELTRARQLMTGLMAEDQAAYTALTAARKLPATEPRRQEMFAAALQACLSVPQAVAATALAILELCDKICGKVNKYLLSDLAIAADLATATVRCAAYNVKVNLGELTDRQRREEIEESTHRTVVKTLATIQRLSPAIWKRQAEK
jgi:formiminotetrahydrofolate cyclodeaminase